MVNGIQYWKDERLAYDHLTNQTLTRQYNVDSQFMNQIWTPDLVFTEEKKGMKHNIIKDNTLLVIEPTGDVMLSQRITLKLHCFMNFAMFPFDSQLCEITIESMGTY